MQCPCCEITRRELYCAKCLQEGVNGHTALSHDLAGQVATARRQAERLLEGPIETPKGSISGAGAWRELRANVAAAEARCAALRAKIARTTEEAERIRASTPPRSSISQRRETLNAAVQAVPTPADLNARIQAVKQQQREVGKRIIQARKVLVREAVDVFGVQRNKGWEIAGLELPAPDLFRLFPAPIINAALVHTVHLLSLLTGYLSISLPFVPLWPPPLELAHVGRPVMAPNIPLVNTKKYREKHTLWMSTTAPAIAKSRKGGFVPLKGSALTNVISRSHHKHRNTLTAFALLAHSVAYLAYTQGVGGIGIPNSYAGQRDSDDEDEYPMPAVSGVLVSATNVLELIALTAESSDLGVRAHEPGTTQMMKHLGFTLDVTKVVEKVLSLENARWGGISGSEGGEALSDGWDLLEKE